MERDTVFKKPELSEVLGRSRQGPPSRITRVRNSVVKKPLQDSKEDEERQRQVELLHQRTPLDPVQQLFDSRNICSTQEWANLQGANFWNR